MAFLKSILLGIAFILALFIYLAKLAPNASNAQGAVIMVFAGPGILLFSIAIGAMLQFKKQRIESGTSSLKMSKATWIIIMIILLAFFVKFVL